MQQNSKKKQNIDYNKLVQDIFQAQNEIRTNPKSFIPRLQEILKYFQGNVLNLPNKIGLITKEGPKAVEECIKFLQTAKAVPELQFSKEMSLACQDHVDDLGPLGRTGHDGSKGSTLESRIDKYGQWESTIGENMSFGPSTGYDSIIQLVIDDGVSSRGHRNNIFNDKFKITGIAAGYHKQYETFIVLDYAGGFFAGQQINQQQKLNFKNLNIGNGGQQQNISDQNCMFQQQQQMSNQSNQFQQQMQQQQIGSQHSDTHSGKKPIKTQTQTSTKIANNTKTITTVTTYTYADGSTKTQTQVQQSKV